MRAKSPALTLAVMALTLVLLVSFSPASAGEAYFGQPAKYVFLFIGDGMGAPQRAAAEFYRSAVIKKNEVGPTKLAMSYFPAQGMTSTHSINSIITDSAASATSLATGYKTKSGVIAMDPAGKTAYKPLSTMAKEKGMKVGIVSSVSIDHATPACFYANAPSRRQYYRIAKQLTESDFDYFGGGGIKSPTGKKGKKPDLYEAARKNGFKTVFFGEDLAAAKPGERVLAVNAWLQDSSALPYDIDRGKDDISLAEFTKHGIRLLDNPKGFFMMVEGGKIDWACHANDAAAAIGDTLAFDAAIQEAVRFYEKHPSETLIVVTGDHECGGMTIGFAGTKYATFFDKLKNQQGSYKAFDGVLKAHLKEYGQGSRFEAVMPVITTYFGLVDLPKEKIEALKAKAKAGDKAAASELAMALTEREKENLRQAFLETRMNKKVRAKDEQTYILYGGYTPLTMALTHTLNNKAGIAWTSYSHTGVPVPTAALGLAHSMFNGFYDNTAIFTKLAAIMKVGPAGKMAQAN